MNPREELPPEVEHRAYYRQPPWKRIVVILAGPGDELLIAFVILWAMFAFHGPYDRPTASAASRRGSPAASVLQPGDRIVAVDGVSGDPQRAVASRSRRHRCAGAQTRRLRRQPRPRASRCSRDGRDHRAVSAAALSTADPEAPAPLLGFSFDVTGDQRGLARRGATAPSSGMWRVTKAHRLGRSARLFDSEEARKQVSGVVGCYEATRQTFKFDDRSTRCTSWRSSRCRWRS